VKVYPYDSIKRLSLFKVFLCYALHYTLSIMFTGSLEMITDPSFRAEHEALKILQKSLKKFAISLNFANSEILQQVHREARLL
jgi:hypothetical protein